MIRLTMLLLLIRFGFPPVLFAVSPATGDPVMIIAAVVGVSVVAMIVLSILSKRGKAAGGGKPGPQNRKRIQKTQAVAKQSKSFGPPFSKGGRVSGQRPEPDWV